jgi:hypothetical protein
LSFCIYAEDNRHNAEFARVMDQIVGPTGVDDVTNM